jgi:ubiquitin C-terminal hydrolase
LVSPPIGLENSGNNCFLNTAFQLILNNDSLRDALERMADRQVEERKNLIYRDLIDEYRACQQAEKTHMRTGNGTAYRRFFQYMVDKEGGVAIGKQGDVNRLFRFFFKELTAYGISISPFEGRYNYDSEGKKSTKLLNQHLYLVYASNPDDIGLGLYEQGERYIEPPPHFLFKIDHARSNANILEFDLPKNIYINKSYSAKYSCRYFSVHRGGFSSGHYYGYIKIENQWYLADDVYITPVADKLVNNFFRDLSKNNDCTVKTAYYELKQ